MNPSSGRGWNRICCGLVILLEWLEIDVHTDPELLALIALGERAGTEADRFHAEVCLWCSQELSEMVRVVSVARGLGSATVLVSPGRRVWIQIRRELGLAAFDELAGGPLRSPVLALMRGWVAWLVPQLRAGSPLLGRTGQARLVPVRASGSRVLGTAEIVVDGRGRRILRVALRGVGPTRRIRRAWLVDREDSGHRLSVGMLDGLHGLWTVDQCVDFRTYTVIEISEQSIDETEHHGRTILRGQLSLTS